METCFGKIKYKYIKGDLAQKFCDLVKEKEKENNLRLGAEEILGMVVFDRSVDFLTLMTTNFTCEGLIDENIGINLGKIKVKNSMLMEGLSLGSNAKKNEIDPNKEVNYSLSSDKNRFFSSISCMRHFDAIKDLHEIISYFQGIIAKNKSWNMKLDSENTLILQEVSFFVTKLKNDLIRVENLIKYVVEILFESKHKKYISKEQPLLSGSFPEDLNSY